MNKFIIFQLRPNKIRLELLICLDFNPPPTLPEISLYHRSIISPTYINFINNIMYRILNKNITTQIDFKIKIPELIYYNKKNKFYTFFY